MRNIFLTIVSALLLAGYCAQAQADKPLPTDKSLRVGRLSNGMTYYIKHNENPAKRADFFIAHNVGALQEEDNQNGLAHFLEHMAFNGSTNFPNKGLLEYTAALGVRFGYNVNAYTSRERTVYNISNVPLLRPAITDTLLMLLHDWSGFLTIDPAALEKERGVIREEWRQGYDTRIRTQEKQFRIEYAGTKYAERDVIGDPEIIRTFDRQTLVDFYHKWYRPDLQAVIVVGDVDVDQMEANIKKTFSTIPAAKNPAPKEEYLLPKPNGPVIATLSDPESKAVTVKLFFKAPYPTVAQRQQESFISNGLRREVCLQMVRGRFALIEAPDTTFWRRASAMGNTLSTQRNLMMVTVIPKQDTNLMAMFTGVEFELERMRRHGFTQQEFNRALSKVKLDTEKQLEKLEQATNTDLAKAYVLNFTRDMPCMAPADEIAVTRKLLAAITYEDAEATMPQMLDQNDELVMFTVPDQKLDLVPDEATCLEFLASLSKADIDPLASTHQAEVKVFPGPAPTPGKIVSSRPIEAFGAEQWTLSNGMKVLFKHIDKAQDATAVQMAAYHYGGYNLTTDYAGLDLLSQYMSGGASINDTPRTDLREMLSKRRISMSASVNKEYAILNGTCTAEDLETLLQVTNRYICAPNFTQQNYDKTMDRIRIGLEKGLSDADRYSDTTARVQYGDNPWLTRATLADAQKMTLPRLRALYDQQFANPAGYTLYICAALPEEQVRQMVCRYLGSIPAAKTVKSPRKALETLPGVREVRYEGKPTMTPKVQINRSYFGDFKLSPANYAALRYVVYILGERTMQSVREEKGGTYYISVKEEVRLRPTPKCYVNLTFKTDPDLADMLAGEIQKDIEAMAAVSPTDQEVAEARLYFEKVWLERHEKDAKTPRIWMDKLIIWDQGGVDLRKDDPKVFMSITPDQVRDLTRAILNQGNRFTSMYFQPGGVKD